MKSVRGLPEVQRMSGPVSIRALAAAHGIMGAISTRNLLRSLSFRTFRETVTTPDPEALGGEVTLTIRGDDIVISTAAKCGTT